MTDLIQPFSAVLSDGTIVYVTDLPFPVHNIIFASGATGAETDRLSDADFTPPPPLTSLNGYQAIPYALGNGDVLIVMTASDGMLADPVVMTAQYDSSGTVVRALSILGDGRAPSVLATDSGGYVLLLNDDPSSATVDAYAIDNAGVISAPNSVTLTSPLVGRGLELPNGQFISFDTGQNATGSSQTPDPASVVLLAANLTQISTTPIADVPDNFLLTGLELNGSGGYAVTFTAVDQTSAGPRLVVGIGSSLGSAAAAGPMAYLTIVSTANLVLFSDVAALPDGSFVVVWSEGFPGGALTWTRLDAFGGVISSGTTEPASGVRGFNVAPLTDPGGSFVISVTENFGLPQAANRDIIIDIDLLPLPQVLTDGSDTLAGTAQDDFLLGLAGQDTLDGAAGNDTIEGGADGDSLDGGSGSDTLSYASSGAGVLIDLGTGTAVGGDATGDQIAGFENLQGSVFADQLAGNATANTIKGGGGNDILQGLGGADLLEGGTGFDFARYSEIATPLTIDLMTPGNSSTAFAEDTLVDIKGIFGSASAANTFVGDDDRTFFTGGTQDDSLTGNGGGDILRGRGGNDTIDGGDGRDALIGNAGNDVMTGGADPDVFYFNGLANGDDVITDFMPGTDLLGFDDPAINAAGDLTFGTATSGALEVAYGTSSIELQGLTLADQGTVSLFFY